MDIVDLQTELPKRLFVVALVVAHLAIPLGGFAVFQIGRVRFVGLFLYGTVAILIFDSLLLWLYVFKDDRQSPPTGGKWITDIRTGIALVALTVAGFALFGRGIVAYSFASVTGAALLYRASIADDTRGTLALIFVFSAVLLVSRSFSTYYLIQTFDTVKHAEIIATIIESGNGEQFRQTRFDGFLGFHYFGAMVSLLTSLTPRTASALLFAFAFPAAALGTFGFIRRWGKDTRVALVATTILVLMPAFLEWGTKAHYQSLSFVYLPFAALSLSAVFDDRRLVLAGVPVILAWVNTHHFSVVMAITLLTVPALINAYRSYNAGWRPNELILASVVAVIVKWTVLTNWFLAPIRWITKYSPVADIDREGSTTTASDEPTETTPEQPTTTTPEQPTTTTPEQPTTTPSEMTTVSDAAEAATNTTGTEQVFGGIRSQLIYTRVLNNPRDLFIASIPFLVDYLYLAFLLPLSVLGFVTRLRNDVRLYAPLIAAGLVALYFYFPNPLWLPLRGLAEFPRWNIMAAPFVAVLVAAGLITFVRRGTGGQMRNAATGIALVVLVFTMISAGFYAPTTSDLIGADRHDRQYLTEADVGAGDWALAHASSSRPVYATSKVVGYLIFTSDPVLSSGGYTFEYVRVSGYHGTVLFEPGLTVFQQEAFRTDAVKMQFDPAASYYPPGVSVTAPLTDENIRYVPETTNLVYSNGETVVHWSNSSDNGTRHSK